MPSVDQPTASASGALPAEAIELLREAGFEPDGEARFAIGRPDQPAIALRSRDGRAAVAKLFRGDKAERTFANMKALWQSSFGATRRPRAMPEPLLCVPAAGLVVMERLAGEPLAAQARLSHDHFDGAIRLLAVLHGSNARSDKERSARGIVRSARRKAARVAGAMPKHAAIFLEAAQTLDAGRVSDSELVPSHGDFSPRNVLATEGGLALIDFDRFQMADPCRDLAYFGTSGWPEALRRGRAPDEDLLKHAAAIYQETTGRRVSGRRLNFHVAAGLLRRAASLVELWPAEAWLAPALCQTALRVLERNKVRERK